MAKGTTKGQGFTRKRGMMQVLLDSNIVIYSLQAEYQNLRKWIEMRTVVISTITELEVLGYHHITPKEIEVAQHYFSLCEIINIDQNIIQTAIQFRQMKKLSLGDAIIAATSSVHKLPLATANIKDFKHLEDLELVNPLEK